MARSSPTIKVDELRKEFRVPVRKPGLRAALASIVRREHRLVTAVGGVSFNAEAGEFVAFLGSNGAGKTTTLKMLTGLLHPTSGSATIAGFDPSRRQRGLLSQLALVMGQRSQLIWDLPAVDSFEVHRSIYRVGAGDFRARVAQFTELLDIGDVVRKPVRNLSLGERMKCELAAALLHQPTVLFLDEPTIGLDTAMQRRMRGFLRQYNREVGATILLTSHYMADVEELCERVIVIDGGKLMFDGGLSALVSQYSSHKTVAVSFAGAVPDVRGYGQVMELDVGRAVLRVNRCDAADVTARLLADHSVTDLVVENPAIEDVIESVYGGAQ